ncbi:YhcH/YjgK/YiaL family protein [Thermoflavifilum thermophilum]|uniref:YhcH/YjgK/YiaL family protein n=1 Tax=Thermoflavifilum thermophilum TaxID=1393122 RepID=A0A1I7NC41_9BACT|nr:YhcH/YjgK/YiaL family protein [Thermoflavifilum thermophilum]SFV32219.1 YhcH/YjgK/YiaL family protein [Thermoflavifilum thermophilum]
MKTKTKFLLLLIFSATMFLPALQVYSQSQATARHWFAEGNWRKNLKIKPSSTIDIIAFYQQYHRDPALWNKVLAFLNRPDLQTLDTGTYHLTEGDSAYAVISTYLPKPMDQTRFESHRTYIDVQYVIQGKEKIGIANVTKANVTEPYRADKDVAHYEAKGEYVTATPDVFFIFFPTNAHRPGIAADDHPQPVKKLVIKVRVL